MSANRYPDNRYPRDRSPYRDRRASNFGGPYPPRPNDSGPRPNPEPSGFPPRDPPRGPKSLGDVPRGPAAGPPSGAPSAPRDGRGRGFAGRGEDTPLRTAPPLSTGTLANSQHSWRADRERERDRDFDRRERRPTPPRRSPARDSRDVRDQRDFVPRDLDLNRARRNSRDGPPSAGSSYSDPPPLGAGSTYRGGGAGRGRGFAGRGRAPFHNDDRDRHHDSRDRAWRPRSRSPPPVRREREERRDERDVERRDREDRRFEPRAYDSYIGPAGAAKPGLRALDTHRGPGPSESRYVPGTPTGPTSHSAHHASPSDRLGSQADLYSRRSSLAVDPSAAKRDAGKDLVNDALLASRAEASRERYAPRASSPPAAVPAFGSNVWRAPALEAKSSTATVPPAKPTVSVSTAPIAPVPAPASVAPTVASAPRPSMPASAPIAPPTGPKVHRGADRPPVKSGMHENRPAPAVAPRMDPPYNPVSTVAPPAANPPGPDKVDSRLSVSRPLPVPATVPFTRAPPLSAPTGPSAALEFSIPPPSLKSLSHGQAPKPRPPPIAPQAGFRANASPQFSRAPFPPHAHRDVSPSAAPSAFGPRSGSGSTSSVNTSPKTLPANIPTGPKADRTPMAPRPTPPMYPPADRPVFDRPGFDRPAFDRPAFDRPVFDRPGFSVPRAQIGGGPKSMQWVRPGLNQNRPVIPSKRELPNEDRERAFDNAPKAPRLESGIPGMHPQRVQYAQSVSPSFPGVSTESEKPRERAASAERHTASSPKPTLTETRRYSDVVMEEPSPRTNKPPRSAASSAPEVLQDSDDDVDLDEDDFAGSEAKYNRERELLQARRTDLSAPHLRAVSPLQEIVLLSCLTIDHLPSRTVHTELKSVEDDVSMYQETESVLDAEPIQQDDKHRSHEDELMRQEDVPMRRKTATPPLPSATLENLRPEPLELLTPKHEDADVGNEQREEKSTAPATVALRLRRGMSAEHDKSPDLSTLPYLGSGPPTPLSDIQQDRPQLSDSVMFAIRDKLRKSIEPDLSTGATLQQYAERYREWRQNVRPLDAERDLEDQERQPSAEPSLKATTPDVSTAGMPGLLDAPLAVFGRRNHASRWATELDYQETIQASLKMAEEERMGKKETEPRRAMADPEKEADLPLELIEGEAQRRRYIDTNFQREPGQGLFVFHYEPPEDDFTEEEHRVMVYNYKDQYAKKWGKLAEILYKEVGTERTYKDCINHYYATKWDREYKGKVRRKPGGKKQPKAIPRSRGAIANMDRSEVPGDEALPLALTETGRPRRSAAPTFGGMETEFDQSAGVPTPGRARRQTDADGTQEKAVRRGKIAKEKGSRKAKNPPLAAAPAGSPGKLDRKEKGPGVKTEDEFTKRPLGEVSMPFQMPTPTPVHASLLEEPSMLTSEPLTGMPSHGTMDRPRTQPSARPGPSSYWSVSELQDFDKNVEHFGTDWVAFANHMGTKTHIMIKNQFSRVVEGGRADLEEAAKIADVRRERGDNLGPPPTPTPAPKRRYESTQTTLPRQIAPTPELQQSPLLSSLALPKTSPPQSAPSARFSTITQAPMQSKPAVPVSGFPVVPDSSLVSMPSLSQQQSPPAPPQRTPSQHHHTLSQQHKPQHPGPRAGFFSDEASSRVENRPPSQSSHQPSRSTPQQQVQSAGRAHDSHQPQPYRSFSHQERDSLTRNDAQQEQEAQHRFQQHARRISQEMHQHRPFGSIGVPPLAPPARSNSIRSPEHRSMSYSHSRHMSQTQPFSQAPPELHSQMHISHSDRQQPPSRSTILTPPVKEESRNLSSSAMPLAQPQTQLHSQHQPHTQQYSQPPLQHTPATAPKPAEPRKSNLMSLLNDAEPEEPRRKKPNEQGPVSHTTTPQQHVPIAPPPPTTQTASGRRGMVYEDLPYSRPSYAHQPAMPAATANRTIDLTNEQPLGGRSVARDNWAPRQPFHPGQGQPQQPGSHSGVSQTPFGDSGLLRNHRSVFAQHNAPRHNPSPPPIPTYNSPLLQSRTPSISGPPGGPSRHNMPSTTGAHQPRTPSSSAQILQPNPYTQVEPPGATVPPVGPMGMRPSPHIHTSHIAHQREVSGRNEHSQTQNANMSYSNPQTPNEHPAQLSQPPPRGPSSMVEAYRPRDVRDIHQEFGSRHTNDRDTGRELAHRADMLREQLANPALRSAPSHEDLRYQPQHHDRGYMSQRSHTPLARSEHSQPPPLQHPPHSSLGTNNHSLYGQRPPEESSHRPFQSFNPRDRSLTERMREEHAQQQHAAMNRDDYMRREDARQREIRDAHARDSMVHRDMRGPPPVSAPGPNQEQRPPAGPGVMDWTSAVRTQHERPGWQR
jgi:serine/arginine repetitive matrix protein 2